MLCIYHFQNGHPRPCEQGDLASFVSLGNKDTDWVSKRLLIFSNTWPFTLIIKMNANHNIATKGETEQVRSTESQALCSSLKGHSQSHMGPATALVRQTLMRNPHTDWPLSGPNESPILIQEREVSLEHTMCAQSSKLPLWPSAPQAAVYPDRNTLTWTTGNHTSQYLEVFFWKFLKPYLGTLTYRTAPQSAHLSLWEHGQGTWGPETTSLSWERTLENTTALEDTGTQARGSCRDKTRASEQ